MMRFLGVDSHHQVLMVVGLNSQDVLGVPQTVDTASRIVGVMNINNLQRNFRMDDNG